MRAIEFGMIYILMGGVPLVAQSPGWLEERLGEIENAERLSGNERIQILGSLVRIPDVANSWRMSEEQKLVHGKALELMLLTPGHADYYAAKIDAAKREVETSEGIRRGVAIGRLANEQMYGFLTLEQMPSPETVKVLGEYLYDSWGLYPDAKPGEDIEDPDDGLNPNATYALLAFQRLPLADPPVKNRSLWSVDYWKDIDAWKIWYEQIKSGARTFRFEGDPQEYTLEGPADRARVPDTTRAAKPISLPMAVPQESDRDGGGSPLSWLALLAACSACAAGVWAVLKGKKGREA